MATDKWIFEFQTPKKKPPEVVLCMIFRDTHNRTTNSKCQV